MSRLLLVLAFASSGAAALIYEITWTRLLALFMGHTVAAAGSVLASFMGGLAIGAAIAGRVAPRLSRPGALRSYAALELVIALLALALPFELAALRPLVGHAYADGHGGATFAAVRLGCALLIVTLPAIAMGATLPLVVRWGVGRAVNASRETAVLYAANTLGAALAAVLTGFVLMPALGMRLTTFVGVALNVVSAAAGIWLARTAGVVSERGGEATTPAAQPSAPRKKVRAKDRAQPPPIAAPRPAIAAAALAISGCASLVLQVAWTRLFALVIGPTTYAFSAIVATFIAGIAIGSFAGGWLGRRGPSPRLLALSLLISGVAAAAAAAWAPRIPLVIAEAAAAPGVSFETMVRLQSLVIAALMTPMTIAFGASFPLAVGLVTREDRRVAADVAMVYAANTIGAIVGALAGAFVLVPRLGIQNSIRAAAMLLACGFAVVAIRHAATRRQAFLSLAAAGAAAIAIWLMPAWDRALLSSGAYKYAAYLPAENREALLRAGTLLYYREGATATVSVRRLAGSVLLAIDGKIDASNAGDMLTQRLLAHAPLLIHPAPRRVGIIGLGSGVTLGSALRHPIEHADTVELSPEVVEASAHFTRENHDALADRRSRLIVGDGRSHLIYGAGEYDVLISEPSNPWMAGVAGLFTREFVEAARARLAPGGVFCQWAHTYDMSDADLRSIAATFTSVFPEASLWLVGESDVLLIGSTEPIEPRLDLVRANWERPGIAADLDEVGVSRPELLLSLLAATGAELKTYAAGAAIQRDDRLALEFTGPRDIYGRSTSQNAETLRALAAADGKPALVLQARDSPAHRAARGRMLLGAEAFGPAAGEFMRAVEHDPTDDAAIDGLLRAAVPAGRVAEVEQLLRRLTRQQPGNTAAAVGLSRMLAGSGNYVEAAQVVQGALAGRAPDVRSLEQLASIFADAGDEQRLAGAVADLQRIAPQQASTLYFSAVLRLMAGRPDEAAALAERLRAGGLARARDLNLLGAAYASLGRTDEARGAFKAAIEADPRDPTAHENLGAFEFQAGNARAAAGHYADALTVDPASASARQGLADALRAVR